MKKVIQDGYILCLSDVKGEEMTEEEYQQTKAVIDNPPKAKQGYGYKLTENLEWEEFEITTETEVEEGVIL